MFLRKQLANPKKTYCIDTGLDCLVSFAFSDNFGRMLENIVFLHLRRHHPNIYYHKSKYQCDFLIVNRHKVEKAVQICRSLHDASTRKRELRGLLDAMYEHGLAEGYIVTEDEEEVIEENGQVIYITPAWKYLLDRSDFPV